MCVSREDIPYGGRKLTACTPAHPHGLRDRMAFDASNGVHAAFPYCQGKNIILYDPSPVLILLTQSDQSGGVYSSSSMRSTWICEPL